MIEDSTFKTKVTILDILIRAYKALQWPMHCNKAIYLFI